MNSVVNSKKIKRVFTVICFVSCLLYILNYIFYNYLENTGTAGTEGFRTFYKLPRNSVDVIFIGPSSVYSSWQPAKAFVESGIASMNLASPGQPFAAKNLMIEAKKTQNPKLFVIDLFSAPNIPSENRITQLGESMKFSINRIKTLNTLLDAIGKSTKEKLDYFFPIGLYHSRWKKLRLTKTNAGHYMGFLFRDGSAPQIISAPDDWYAQAEQPDGYPIETLEELIHYCKLHPESRYLFTIPPMTTANKMSLLNWARETVMAAGYDVFDAYAHFDEIGLDPKTDFLNELHLNVYGSIKYTEYFEKYLKQNFNLPDHRGDKKYTRWEKEYNRFLSRLQEKRSKINLSPVLGNVKEFDSYLDKIDNAQYSVLFSICHEGTSRLSENQLAKLHDLGFRKITKKFKYSFIGVLENEKKVYERFESAKPNPISHSGTLADGTEYTIQSQGAYDDKDGVRHKIASIKIKGEEYAINKRGFNIVVYDNRLHKVIDSTCWDIFNQGKLYRR